MVVFPEVGVHFDTAWEFVCARSLSCHWVLAPCFLNWKGQGWNSQRVGECRVVVHLKFIHWVTRSTFRFQDVINSWRFSSDGGWGDYDVNIFSFQLLTPLRNQQTTYFLSNTDLLIVLFVFWGKEEVTQHNSTFYIKSKIFRPYSLDVVKEIFTLFKFWLCAIFEAIKPRKIGCCFSWDKCEIKRQTVLH